MKSVCPAPLTGRPFAINMCVYRRFADNKTQCCLLCPPADLSVMLAPTEERNVSVVARVYSPQHRYTRHCLILNPEPMCLSLIKICPCPLLVELDKHEAKMRRRRYEQSHGISVHATYPGLICPSPNSLPLLIQRWPIFWSACPAWASTSGCWWNKDTTR